MEQITAFKKDYKKNNTRNKKAFELFINQKKDFNDDIFSVIKEFMIEPRYKKSYRFTEHKEVRYNPCCVDATTFFIGKRYNNLIQVKLIRNDENELIDNPEFKFYKIKTMELKNGIDETDIILLEYLDIKFRVDEDPYDGKIYVVYYMIGADKIKNKLWTDEDSKRYEIRMDEIREHEALDYQDYIDDIEQMMD